MDAALREARDMGKRFNEPLRVARSFIRGWFKASRGRPPKGMTKAAWQVYCMGQIEVWREELAREKARIDGVLTGSLPVSPTGLISRAMLRTEARVRLRNAMQFINQQY